MIGRRFQAASVAVGTPAIAADAWGTERGIALGQMAVAAGSHEKAVFNDYGRS